MAGHSTLSQNHFMSAASGVDIYGPQNTDSNSPPYGAKWKGCVVLAEAVFSIFTDSNTAAPSTGIVATTFPVGSVITASGVVTNFTLSSGTVMMIRGA